MIDSRAETSPLIETVVARKDNGHLPRFLRAPMFAAAGLGSIAFVLSGCGGENAGVAAAQTPNPTPASTATPEATPTVKLDPNCTIRKFGVLGLGIIDHPTRENTIGLTDAVDLNVGVYEFGPAVLTVRKNPLDSKSPIIDQFMGNMIVNPEDGQAEVVFNNLKTTANTKALSGKPAAAVEVSFKEDKVRQSTNSALPPQKPIIVECGEDGVAWGGRYATEEDINIVAKGSKGVSSVGAKIDRFMEKIFGKGRTFKLTSAGENSQQNAKIVSDNLANLIQHAKLIRTKERDLASGQK